VPLTKPMDAFLFQTADSRSLFYPFVCLSPRFFNVQFVYSLHYRAYKNLGRQIDRRKDRKGNVSQLSKKGLLYFGFWDSNMKVAVTTNYLILVTFKPATADLPDVLEKKFSICTTISDKDYYLPNNVNCVKRSAQPCVSFAPAISLCSQGHGQIEHTINYRM